MPLIKHFTNAEHLSSIYADGVLKLEGSNIEHVIRNKVDAYHPSGIPVKNLWKAMKLQYKYVGRYVWLTEEKDVRCITAQRNFQKEVFTFDAEEIGALRWLDVAKRIAFKSKKARKIIQHMNATARLSGDDVSKWWIVKNDIDLNKVIITQSHSKLQYAA